MQYNETIQKRCVQWLYPEHRAEARQDMQFLNVQKLGNHEAEIEKIMNEIPAILRDIMGDIDSGKRSRETATAAMLEILQEAIKDQKQELLFKADKQAEE